MGTSHHGSAIADFARLKVGRLYRILRLLGIEHRGFHDDTRRATRAVGRSGFAPLGVPCFSVSGNPALADVCLPLHPFFEILSEAEGPNDGLVSVESAEGFGTALPSWPVDHFRQMSWMPPSSGQSSGRAILNFYELILANLSSQGFPGETIETPSLLPSATKSSRPGGFSRLGEYWQPRVGRRPVNEDRDGHVTEDIRCGPTTVEEPVDRKKDGDLVGG